MKKFLQKFININGTYGIDSAYDLPPFSNIVDVIVSSFNSGNIECYITFETTDMNYYNGQNYGSNPNDTKFYFRCYDEASSSNISVDDDYKFLANYLGGGELHKNIYLLLYKKVPGVVELRDCKINTISE